MDFSQAVERITNVWKDLEEGRVCLALFKHLSQLEELPPEVSIDLLRTGGGSEIRFSESAVAGALGYLIGHNLHFLDIDYSYRRRDGTCVPLARAAMFAIYRGDHREPDTAELAEDLTERVFLHFRISEAGKGILASCRSEAGVVASVSQPSA